MDIIDTINELRQVAHSDFAAQVKHVAVILTAPRSGSSLLKSVLSTHPEIASLDGEMEPFLALTRNGFGRNSDSDAFSHLDNRDALLDNIFDDMTLPAVGYPEYDFLRSRWEKRLLLQFPSLFSNADAYSKLLLDLDAVFDQAQEQQIQGEAMLQDLILSRIFKSETWRLDYYDGKKSPAANHCFNEAMKLEEPPFVLPRHYRRRFRAGDAREKTLLFKTPPDVYRLGIYEQLFPNAQIKYLHLTRGYAQSVNGLMDGWLSPVAFFSRDLEPAGVNLAIKGYSNHVGFGKRWWKFDLPPNWREYINASLEDVCLNQWLSAHQTILASRVETLPVSFEEFLSKPAVVIKKITSYLGLREMPGLPAFPVTMATEAPKIRRWQKREDSLLRLGGRSEVKNMMGDLAYQMSPDTWL
ncbi:sulfotransferase [Undibacterium umbellatum]|uniref:Sulfotransferase n=1 Tax=Undibacterium umbellatum TaxID=2762300 RepID=A0ABR6Z3H4_9BURK|nr:sulfotransferase [Undibacterium umbellatum]MBC3906173.1 sulfotransferase [Undibacterium umbellatum]